jgi:hypothetical protein
MTDDRKRTSLYDLWEALTKPKMFLPGPCPDGEVIVGDSDPDVPNTDRLYTVHRHPFEF